MNPTTLSKKTCPISSGLESTRRSSRRSPSEPRGPHNTKSPIQDHGKAIFDLSSRIATIIVTALLWLYTAGAALAPLGESKSFKALQTAVGEIPSVESYLNSGAIADQYVRTAGL